MREEENMRPIKFRAWITNANYTGQRGMGIVESAEFTGTKQPFDFVELVGFESSFRLDDVEIMQFTGLKDRNGKEIYEGDIVFAPLNKKKYVIGIGFYGDDEGSAGEFSHYGVFGKTMGGYSEEMGSAGLYVEVIGNIYENPELLEAK
jgi:hypothetical protein